MLRERASTRPNSRLVNLPRPDHSQRLDESTRQFQPGDHACVIYSSRMQLARVVSRFLAEGLERHEHCWYVGATMDHRPLLSALRRRGLDPDHLLRVGALKFLLPADVYLTGGEFQAARADQVFSDAITQARIEGFRGLRAAVDVSWVSELEHGAERLVAYEAHAQAGFAAAPVTGLCLYHRRRLPLHLLHGALLTHPLITATRGAAAANPFYQNGTTTLPPAPDREVIAKLHALTTLMRRSRRRR